MNRLLRGSLLLGCIVLGCGTAVLFALAQPDSDRDKARKPLPTRSPKPSVDVRLGPSPDAGDSSAPPHLAAEARVEPIPMAYAPAVPQQADGPAVGSVPPAGTQSGISADTLLKVLEKFSAATNSQQAAPARAAPAGPSLRGASGIQPGDTPASDDVEAPKPEDLMKMAGESEDLPAPGGAGRQDSHAEGEASITHLPGYSEGDDHLEIHIQDEDLR